MIVKYDPPIFDIDILIQSSHWLVSFCSCKTKLYCGTLGTLMPLNILSSFDSLPAFALLTRKIMKRNNRVALSAVATFSPVCVIRFNNWLICI